MPEKHRSRTGLLLWTPIIGLAVLFAAGIVLALDGLVDVPGPVVEVALLVALVAAVAVVGATWVDSRRRGLGPVRSLGRSLRNLGRFCLEFF